MLSPKAKENLAVAFSIVAFLFSSWTFYDSYVRESHSLKITVLDVGLAHGSKDAEFRVDAIALNDGNRSEVLLSASLEVKCPTSTIPFPNKEPVTLKAGEAQAIQFRHTIPIDDLNGEMGTADTEEKEKTEYGTLILVVRTVTKKGAPVVRRIPLWILIADVNGDPHMVRKCKQLDGFIQLLGGKDADGPAEWGPDIRENRPRNLHPSKA